MKSLAFIHRNDTRFAVGDFYPVLSVFSYHELGNTLSPFLLLDHLGPGKIAPSIKRRGVNDHPHRGFETVTLVYTGELEHKDSSGGGGFISAGDVQWMTAGAGILHEEFHSPEFTRKGGELEMVQLWVNLPAKDKMAVPGYQGISSDVIPTASLPDEAGSVRVIAGSYQDKKGPAHTFSPMNVWDMRLQRNHQFTLSQPEGWSTALIVLKGSITVNGTTPVSEAQLVVLSQQGKTLHIEATNDANVLLLAGEPLNEPIVGYGPFVMNTKQEIAEAVRDFNSGRFGQI